MPILTLMPFIEKSPYRYYSKRVLPISIMTIMVTGIVLLTLMSEVPTVSEDGSTLLGTLQTVVGIFIPLTAYILFFAFKNNTRLMLWTVSLAAVSMILNKFQEPGYVAFTTSGARVGDPGHNLIGPS